jgi:hypothetical protein
MVGDIDVVSQALGRVQALLDKLTASGRHATAFEIARAQFSASMRASWPSNLVAIASAIDKAIETAGDAITDDERRELESAAASLRSVPHP